LRARLRQFSGEAEESDPAPGAGRA